jgi:hypothetical protein
MYTFSINRWRGRAELYMWRGHDCPPPCPLQRGICLRTCSLNPALRDCRPSGGGKGEDEDSNHTHHQILHPHSPVNPSVQNDLVSFSHWDTNAILHLSSQTNHLYNLSCLSLILSFIIQHHNYICSVTIPPSRFFSSPFQFTILNVAA